MSRKLKIFVSLIIIYSLVPLYQWITNQRITKTSLSDSYFLIALLFLIIGVIILVFSSGFFDRFQEHMHLLVQRRKNREKEEFTPFSKTFSFSPIYWLVIGTILIVSSVLLIII